MRSVFTSIAGSILLASLSSLVQAAPAAPVVTVGADIKQLQFDWDQVPTSNTYELWFKANAGAAWVRYSTIPAAQTARIRINVSVHLLDWRVAKYRVAACNPSGCTNSAEVGVSELPLEAIGYFKPNTTTSRYFGHAVALSADGTTFAAVNGETFGSAGGVATVYVYRKTTPTGGWRREARLLTSTLQPNTSSPYIGTPLALSGNGNVLVLGLAAEDVGSTTPLQETGAVYVFRREGTTWHEEQKLTGAVRYLNWYGLDVDIDDAGNTLVVGRNLDDAGATARGTTDLYVHGDGGWTRTQTLPLNTGVFQNYSRCRNLVISGDGSRLARSCTRSGSSVQVFDIANGVATPQNQFNDGDGPIDMDMHGTTIAVRHLQSQVGVWEARAGTWSLAGVLDAGGDSSERNSIAISRDGKLVASESGSLAAGSGPIYPGNTSGGEPSAAVAVYERNSQRWALRRVLKPTVATGWYGHSLALGDNGRILAVGSPFDASAATGIGGDQANTSAPDRGAAWLY
jgi:hypothetical protein